MKLYGSADDFFVSPCPQKCRLDSPKPASTADTSPLDTVVLANTANTQVVVVSLVVSTTTGEFLTQFWLLG